MSCTTEPEERVATRSDERRHGDDESARRLDRTDVDPFSSADLRTITPEEIQILAATGC